MSRGGLFYVEGFGQNQEVGAHGVAERSDRVTDHSGGNGIRRAMRALGDTALVEEMRAGRPEAWHEFDARFQPVLQMYAERTGIPPDDWDACVVMVVDDVAMRVATRDIEIPTNMSAYLVRMAYYARLHLRRDDRRRERVYELALRDASSEGVLRALCSQAALRESADPLSEVDDQQRHALDRFVTLLEEELDPEERHLLSWAGEGVPRRQIAQWMGTSYEAMRKRILRITVRTRQQVAAVLKRLASEDRAEVERLLARFNFVVEEGQSSNEARTGHAG